MFSGGGRMQNAGGPCKLRISNLEFGVNDNDIVVSIFFTLQVYKYKIYINKSVLSKLFSIQFIFTILS